jgi:hypothetical protein
MAEGLITWVVPVARERLDTVERLLKRIDDSPAANAELPLGDVPMLHFANLTLFERDGSAGRTLVFESNIDGKVEPFVEALVAAGKAAIDTLFADAPDYRARPTVAYLCKTCRKPQLYHVGHPGRGVQEIRGDHELRRSIEREFRDNGALADKTPADLIETLRATAHCPGFFSSWVRPWHEDWSDPPVPGAAATPLREIHWERDSRDVMLYGRELMLATLAGVIEFAAAILLGHYLFVPLRATLIVMSAIIVGLVSMSAPDVKVLRGIVAAAVIAAVVAKALVLFGLHPVNDVQAGWRWIAAAWAITMPTMIIAASYVYITMRLKVTAAPAPIDPGERKAIARLMEAEDQPRHSIYNHVAGLSTMKPGFRLLRRVRSWLALRFLNLFYRTYFVRGKLVSIASIHFAQWSLIGEEMLFLTNYDGSADSYLDDFFTGLAKGVAFIWYDMREFPGTTDPRGLKRWVRSGQTLASARYRAGAYDGLTVDMINNNFEIRCRLLRGRSARTARRWVRRFTTTPVEPTLAAQVVQWVTGGAE